MSLPRYLDFETISTCNRVCPTCIRNSHPNREAVASWFEPHLLDEAVVYAALDQAAAWNFRGGVCLSHYNEPLMDERIPAIAARVRAYNLFSPIFLNTNGDFITEDLAASLDGVLDRIIITLYMDEPVKSKRAAWLQGLFRTTDAQVLTMSEHIPTHFSPKFPVEDLAKRYRGAACHEPAIRIIINHRSQYLLCCEDVIGNFDLGTFPEKSLEEHWNGRHSAIQAMLGQPGGRSWHNYCLTCPRT